MIFNDLAFLFLFLPTTAAAFFLAPRWLREWVMLAASLVFYGLAGAEHVVVLLGCMAWVWAFTVSDSIRDSRWRLAAAILGPMAALLYYKYLGFIVRDILPQSLTSGWRPQIADKLLPAGISFFTFHLVAFAFDRFHGLITRQPKLAHFMLYITFFPHLVAGPILRYHEVSEALAVLNRFRPAEENWRKAIIYFCCGLAGKVLLADGLSGFIKPLSASVELLSPLSAFYVLIAYSFQIYFDFWGYSLMATGLACLFGFTFPLNFNRPYSALNPQDFWRRWHMSLSRWFRDYLYIPLGGNRRYKRNIILVFMVCGLWHGAAWQFMVWGGFHGLLIVAYHLTKAHWDRVPRLAQQGLTFLLVSLGWTLFLFDFPTAWSFLHSLVGAAAHGGEGPDLTTQAWAMLAISALACFVVDVERLAASQAVGRLGGVLHSLGFAAAFVLALLFIDRSGSFIYFRF